MASRLSPATAVTGVAGLLRDVRDLLGQLDRHPATHLVRQALAEVPLPGQGSVAMVDVALFGSVAPTRMQAMSEALGVTLVADAASGWMARDAGLPLRVIDAAAPPATAAGAPEASLLVCVPGDGMSAEQVAESAALLCDARPVVVTVGADDAAGSAVAGVASQRAWIARAGDAATLATLADAASGRGRGTPLLQCCEALRAVASALEAAGVVATRELRGARARRTLAQQRVSKVMLPAPGAPMDLLNDVRQRATRHFGEFERGIQDRMRTLVAPQVGSLTRDLERRIEELEGLESVERAKTVQRRVPAEIESGLLDHVRRTLATHCAADLRSVQDLYRLVQGDMDEVLEAAGMPQAPVSFTYLPQERLERTLSTHVRIDRPYRGEVPKHGWMEFLQVARRYQALVPLLISMFGVSLASVQGAVSKRIMIPLSIAVLAAGALIARRTMTREKAEEDEKELERARESLRVESRRMLADVEREWNAAVTEHLRQQLAAVSAAAEQVVRETTARRGQDLAAEKRRAQSQLQGVETDERQLDAIVRTHARLTDAVTQYRADLRLLLQAELGTPAGAR